MDLGGVVFFILGRPFAGEDAQGLMVGSAEDLGADGGGAVDRPFKMLDSPGAGCSICADGAVLGVGDDGDSGTGQARVDDGFADFGKMGRVTFEEGNFDAVVTDFLEDVEIMEVFVGDVGGPEQ